MHEADASRLIKPVLDFFIVQNFPLDPSSEEYEHSVFCIRDFIKDWEPYWVGVKAAHVIKTFLVFKQDIGVCPPTLKEAVLAVVRFVRKSLTKMVWEDCPSKDAGNVKLDIGHPTFITLNSWARIDWNRKMKPRRSD